MKRLIFTSQVIALVESDPVYDAIEPHLGIYRAKRNGPTFFLYAKVNGRPVRRVLGTYPDLSIESARRLAGDALQSIKGEGIYTIEALFEKYYSDYAVHRCRTASVMKKNFYRYFGELKKLPAETVSPYQVQSWHNQLGTARGEPTANRSLQLLRAIYNFAIRWRLIDCRNPAQAVRKFKEESRDRFLRDEEIGRLFAAIDAVSTQKTGDVFRLCLLTGQRIANVRSMRWQDVNFERAVWVIPRANFKTGSSHAVPLSPEAIEILVRRRQSNKVSPWVFPARRGSGCLVNPYIAWRKVIALAELDDLRIHDLRRTLATWQVRDGFPLPVIAKTLGHADFKSTAIYARCPVESVRIAIDKAAERLRPYLNSAARQT